MVKCAHVVQAISQLHKEDADIISNRKQELAEVLGLFCFSGNQIQALDLSKPLYELADLFAKHAINLGTRGIGVLNGVVKKGDSNGCVVKLQIREDCSNFKRVGNIRIPRGAGLGTMLLHGVNICLVEQCFIRIGIVAGYFLNKFVLTHHFRAAASL